MKRVKLNICCCFNVDDWLHCFYLMENIFFRALMHPYHNKIETNVTNFSFSFKIAFFICCLYVTFSRTIVFRCLAPVKQTIQPSQWHPWYWYTVFVSGSNPTTAPPAIQRWPPWPQNWWQMSVLCFRDLYSSQRIESA